MKIPISVISGYLGAGKTTLLKRIIGKLDRRFAILMNEFGDIGIDTDIIKGKNINVKELLGGCVCCSLTGEFEEAVKEILKETFLPEPEPKNETKLEEISPKAKAGTEPEEPRGLGAITGAVIGKLFATKGRSVGLDLSIIGVIIIAILLFRMRLKNKVQKGKRKKAK